MQAIWPTNRLITQRLFRLGQEQPDPRISSLNRSVALSRAEAAIIFRLVDSVAGFSTNFPLEFNAYCPSDRWNSILQSAGEGAAQLKAQLDNPSKQSVVVSAKTLFAVMDLEECVSGAKDRRLASAKAALVISAIGAGAQVFFGLDWAAFIAYVLSLAVVVTPPLIAMATKEPAEPFTPEMAGGFRMGASSERPKFLERAILSPEVRTQRHHWGWAFPGSGPEENAVCLEKGLFRVRVEGWQGIRVTPARGWKLSHPDRCRDAKHIAAVWEPCGTDPRNTLWGKIPESAGNESSYFIEYAGPFTEGSCRTAGPFCCKMDSIEYAIEDSGMSGPQIDGAYILLDASGVVVEERT